MGETTGISWTDSTFNPWIGCAKVSPGCTNCYAEVLNKRFGKDVWGVGKPRQRTTPANWRNPLAWNKAAAASGKRHLVFCASMADWLDPEVPVEWLADLLVLIAATPALTWQLLTKRPELWRQRVTAAGAVMTGPWVDHWLAGTAPANVWIGTTVEDQRRADERIPALLTIPARVRFLSMEPLLEQVDLGLWLGDYDCHACNRRFWGDDGNSIGLKAVGFRCDEDCTNTDGTCECSVEVCPHCQTDNGDGNSNATVGPRSESDEEYHPTGIHWVIVGGESGHHARWFNVDWARSIVQQCKTYGVAVFVKQLGAMPFLEPPVSWLVEEGSDYKNRYLIDEEGRAWPRLDDKGGANPAEWPADLRVQEFPK